MAFECPSCRHVNDVELFMQPRHPGDKMKVTERGDFFARCVECNERRKWYLSDAIPAHPKRKFTEDFKRDFITSVANKLKLCAVDDCVYRGPALLQHRFDGVSLRLMRHDFKYAGGESFS